VSLLLLSKENFAVNKEQYAPWEKTFGFASDHFLKTEASRAGEYELNRRPAFPSTESKTVRLLSSAQWKERRRRVISDAAPVKVVVTKAGHPLRLFSLEQTSQI
jgi:hypothetical protein